MMSPGKSKKSQSKKSHSGAGKVSKDKREELYQTGVAIEQKLLKVNISGAPDFVTLKSGGVDLLFSFELGGYGENEPFGLMPREAEPPSSKL